MSRAKKKIHDLHIVRHCTASARGLATQAAAENETRVYTATCVDATGYRVVVWRWCE